MMIQIEDIVVSSDIITEKFLCNLEACKGECCIEGDAGAPVEESEVKELEKVLPVVWDELSPEAKAIFLRRLRRLSKSKVWCIRIRMGIWLLQS